MSSFELALTEDIDQAIHHLSSMTVLMGGDKLEGDFDSKLEGDSGSKLEGDAGKEQ